MSFQRIDTRALAPGRADISVISPVRNEIGLLPHFLSHHRRLGISQFVMIDNGSVDGTTEYLLSQPDCIVYATDESFSASNMACDWIDRILRESRYFGWLLYLDADEHLVYQDMERMPVSGLLARLNAQGADTVLGIMVDMYPEGDFLELKITPECRLRDLMPWFDSDYVLRPWPQRPWDPRPEGFRLQVLGGPRCRLLSDLTTERRRGGFHYTMTNQVDRFVDHVPLSLMPALARIWPREVPAQHKKPLNFVRDGFRYINSHSSTNHRAAAEGVALLHYKFCHELQQRYRYAAAEGNHYRRGLSYQQLNDALRRWGRRPLTYSGSRRYQSSRDLDSAGLIGPRPADLWMRGLPEVVLGDTGATPDAGQQRRPRALARRTAP
jgi:hypothetical protein